MKAVALSPGERFGRLTVVERAPSVRGHVVYSCRCDCGEAPTVRGSTLASGVTLSCGCRNRELQAALGGKKRTHGRSKTALYARWQTMLERCSNPKATGWELYGGRGITVCARWHSFENFLADMGEPAPGLSLDRIDNDGSYEPSNCRWSTQSEQNLNNRRSKAKRERTANEQRAD